MCVKLGDCVSKGDVLAVLFAGDESKAAADRLLHFQNVSDAAAKGLIHIRHDCAGDCVSKGDVLAVLFAGDESKAAAARARLLPAIEIGEKPENRNVRSMDLYITHLISLFYFFKFYKCHN